ncbi:hypothetical protein M430DRAFT_38113 [Amorphotheca resinae ATCC 22711]|uniref:Distal membrane-arm assembly complex protein 1-like domain-containing protein n=1 Tax=Amorphotheca resinae ATCC 22711 TaxID=857342 RepID=A0A2T3BD48_AMORE|nr:hypothetical protein M430DRAFT_38113 [Amorphotheca resinae ATCC 22711]PSS27331.1 hypothetical protein M430DRAFT_38113 [Amorphotheca resinae ATCC 22711]
MAIPPVEQLQRPEPLRDVLAKDKPEDCLPCRVTGATAFIGLGAYSYFSGHSQLKAQEAKILQSKSLFGMKSRQAGITTIALSLVGMGLWRLVN